MVRRLLLVVFAQQTNEDFFITKVNKQITAPIVIGENTGQLGVMPIEHALELARSKGVDLVEISAGAKPPICQLVDFGKYRYEQKKKIKASQEKPSSPESSTPPPKLNEIDLSE